MAASNRLNRKVLAVIAVLVLVASAMHAQTAREIAKKASPSVVMLVMEDKNGQPLSLGSGFVVRGGIIATNLHVVEGASGGYAKLAGQKEKHNIEGTVGINTFTDLVLLSCKGLATNAADQPGEQLSAKPKALPLALGDSNLVEVGDEVYVIGNPMGLEGTLSRGIVSGIRKIEKDKLFQITAPISPGSSGGPVLNAKGEVIGVAVATFKGGQNLNLAIPVSYLSSLLANIKPLKPFSSMKQSEEAGLKSIFGDLYSRSSEGVKGVAFKWDSQFLQSGYYSFSLKNQLREAVTDVYCLVIFYDIDNEPLDVDEIRSRSTIPPRLAKRVTGKVHESVQKLTSTKVEIRILSFKLEEPDETKGFP